jgi:hypothetical protein
MPREQSGDTAFHWGDDFAHGMMLRKRGESVVNHPLTVTYCSRRNIIAHAT